MRARILAILGACIAVGALCWIGDGAAAQTQAKPPHLVSHVAPRSVPPGTIECPAGAPCVSWQDQNATSVQQDIELFDHAGAPIWWCNNAGGCWAGNDRMGITNRRLQDLVYFTPAHGGEVVVRGLALTRADVAEIGLMVKAHVTLHDMRWLVSHARTGGTP